MGAKRLVELTLTCDRPSGLDRQGGTFTLELLNSVASLAHGYIESIGAFGSVEGTESTEVRNANYSCAPR